MEWVEKIVNGFLSGGFVTVGLVGVSLGIFFLMSKRGAGNNLPNGNENVDWLSDMYMSEMSRILQDKCFEMRGFLSLPEGRSWVELTQELISRMINPDLRMMRPDLTHVDILANAYELFLESGPSNEIMEEVWKIIHIWQQQGL
jgi:hypothetical protein